MNQNQCFLVGRVATKPELKGYQNAKGEEGFRVWFRLAITRLMDRGAERDKQRTNFIEIVAWGGQAKRHAQYLDVGTEITVVGELIVDQPRDENGELKRRSDGSVIQYVNVSARDIQYGQPSLKNATADQVQRRMTALTTRMDQLQSTATPTGSDAPAPDASASTGGNPFTEDGQPPATPSE
jgi:single-stranded DNA-binding protein